MGASASGFPSPAVWICDGEGGISLLGVDLEHPGASLVMLLLALESTEN